MHSSHANEKFLSLRLLPCWEGGVCGGSVAVTMSRRNVGRQTILFCGVHPTLPPPLTPESCHSQSKILLRPSQSGTLGLVRLWFHLWDLQLLTGNEQKVSAVSSVTLSYLQKFFWCSIWQNTETPPPNHTENFPLMSLTHVGLGPPDPRTSEGPPNYPVPEPLCLPSWSLIVPPSNPQ